MCQTPSNDKILSLLYCIAPQFANPTQEQLDCYNELLDLVKLKIDKRIMCCHLKEAYVYLLAHMLTMKDNPNLGTTSSMSEGSLSVSFLSGGSDILSCTSYGRSYKDLLKKTIFAPFTTGSPATFNTWC